MKIKKGKKGASHVEIIISFVIFISFIVFMLIIFKPLRLFPKSTTSFDITEKKILEDISVNLSISSLKINSSADVSGTCFFVNYTVDNNLIIKDEQEAIINAETQDNKTYFEKSGYFYRIYSSEGFEEKTFDTGSCYELSEENYTIGVTRFYKKTSYSRLDDFFQQYNGDYTQLKQNLGIRSDFNAVITDSSGTIIFEGVRYQPEGIEIMAKDILIEILNENATINQAVMNLQVWK